MAVATALFRTYSARAYRRMRERLGLVTATLQEDLSGVRVMQAYGREETNLANFRSVNGSYRDANQQTVYAERLLLPGRRAAVERGHGDRVRLRRLALHPGQLGLGTLVAFTGYLSNFFDPVQQLSQLYNTFLAAQRGARQDLRRDGRRADARRPRPEPPTSVLDGAVDFDDVHFGYRADREVLHGLTLHADAGQTVALVGIPEPASRRS